jgi:hypothetical protein
MKPSQPSFSPADLPARSRFGEDRGEGDGEGGFEGNFRAGRFFFQELREKMTEKIS